MYSMCYKEYYKGKLAVKPTLDDIHLIIMRYLKKVFTNKYQCSVYDINMIITDNKKQVTSVRPDIAVYDSSIKNFSGITTKPPKIVFEIVTTKNNGDETVFKPNIYSDLGVLEYWLIDTFYLTIEISDFYNDEDFSYKFCSGCVKSLLFNNIFLNFEDIYKELVYRKLIIPKSMEDQVGFYAPKGSNFDPWKIIRDES